MVNKLGVKSNLFLSDYDWGSGCFRDIAYIRRKVYTVHYIEEHEQLLAEILGFVPKKHCQTLLAEIENPLFFIDSKRYEEIKQYLWQRSLREFEKEISSWLIQADNNLVNNSKMQLAIFDKLWNGISTSDDLRKSILLLAAFDLFPSYLEEYDNINAKSIEEMLSKPNTPYGAKLPIDFTKEFFQNVIIEPNDIAIVTGDINSVAPLLRWTENLLKFWTSTQKNDSQFSITLLVNSEFTPRNNNKVFQKNATLRNIQSLLKNKQFSKLKTYKKNGVLKICSYSSNLEGMVLTELNSKTIKILKESKSVIACGEQNLITLHGIQKNAYFIFPIRDFSTIFFTGIKNDLSEQKYPNFSTLFVPVGLKAAINYVPDKPTTINALDYYKIYKMCSKNEWKQIIAQISSNPTSSRADGLTKKLQILNELNQTKIIKHTQQIMAKYGGKYIRQEEAVNAFQSRVVHIIHFPINHKPGLIMSVLRKNNVKNYKGSEKQYITFYDLINNTQNPLFGFNFLYFLTRAIISRYNKTTPHCRLSNQFFGEYIGFQKSVDDGILYPPLYNKGAVGWSNDGNYVFGRVSMPNTGKVSINIDSHDVQFEWQQLNHTSVSADFICLYTPFNDLYKSTQFAEHSFGEKRAIYLTPNSNNINFVIVNDKCIGIVQGQTEIPPFGNVLSVPASKIPPNISTYINEKINEVNRFSKERSLRKDEKFSSLEDSPLKVKFDFPLDNKWSTCTTIMGGGLLMVNDGKREDLIYKQGKQETVYEKEGWSLESSQRTQETPVETELNEARTTIGLTDDNQLYLVIIEGRANNRTGATHTKTMDWIENYFRQVGTVVKYMLDLDSASSVSLGLINNNNFYLLNQTARGSDSKLGDTRYHNHIGYFTEG